MQTVKNTIIRLTNRGKGLHLFKISVDYKEKVHPKNEYSIIIGSPLLQTMMGFSLLGELVTVIRFSVHVPLPLAYHTHCHVVHGCC